MFDLKERHDIEELEKEFANKNFFNSKMVKIFKFMVAIISIIATVVTIHVICKHNKIKSISNQFSTSTGKRSQSREYGECRQ